MVYSIRQLLVALIVVAVAVYVVVSNSNPVSVVLGNSTMQGSLGVVLLIAFVAGIISTSLFAILYAVRGYLRERALKIKERDRVSFYDGVIRARNFFASGEWELSRAQWERVMRKDPTNVIARIELSRSYEGAGDLQEALRVLDEARSASPENVEVLYRAAELNMSLGNKTAALDNIALILQHQPSKRSAQIARNLAVELEKFDDALLYQKTFEELGGQDIDSQEVLGAVAFKKIVKENRSSEQSGPALRDQLKELVRKYPDYTPALKRLAELEVSLGNVEGAVPLLVRVAKKKSSAAAWHEVSSLWLAQKNPERALSATKAAVKDAEGETKILAQAELVWMQIALNMLDEASSAADVLDTLIRETIKTKDNEYSFRQLLLRALLQAKRNNIQDTQKILEQLCEGKFVLASREEAKSLRHNDTRSAPSPALSTP